MEILNLITPASRVRKILIEKLDKHETRDWQTLFHFYQCRFLGICIYRATWFYEREYRRMTGEAYPRKIKLIKSFYDPENSLPRYENPPPPPELKNK